MLSPTTIRRFARTLSTDGFTIVEVLIAGLIIVIAVGGTTLLVAKGTEKQIDANYDTQVRAKREAVLEIVQGDTSIRSNDDCKRPNVGCRLTYDVRNAPTLGANGPNDLNASAVVDIKPRFETVRNRQILAAFDADITMTLTDARNRPLSNRVPVTFTGTIDTFKAKAFGTVTVQLCEVTGQIDERKTIGQCPNRSSDYSELLVRPTPATASPFPWMDYPTDTSRANISNDGQNMWPQEQAAMARKPFNATWWQWDNARDQGYAHTTYKPIRNRWVSVVGTGDDGDSINESVRSDNDGYARFVDIPKGNYTLNLPSPPAGTVPWFSHWSPAVRFMYDDPARAQQENPIRVNPNMDTRIVRLYKPKPVDVKMKVRTIDHDIPWNVEWEQGVSGASLGPDHRWRGHEGAFFALRPFPEGRAYLQGYDPRTRKVDVWKWAHVGRNGEWVTFNDIDPGLYQVNSYRMNLKESRLAQQDGDPNTAFPYISSRKVMCDPNGHSTGCWESRVSFLYVKPDTNGDRWGGNGGEYSQEHTFPSHVKQSLPACGSSDREEVMRKYDTRYGWGTGRGEGDKGILRRGRPNPPWDTNNPGQRMYYPNSHDEYRERWIRRWEAKKVMHWVKIQDYFHNHSNANKHPESTWYTHNGNRKHWQKGNHHRVWEWQWDSPKWYPEWDNKYYYLNDCNTSRVPFEFEGEGDF
jgi:hypothetical protein